jgi:hypothetical protein
MPSPTAARTPLVRVDPATKEVKVWPLHAERMPYTNLEKEGM